MVFGRSDYHYQHEPMFYGWKPGAAHFFTDDRTQTSVWNIDRPTKSDHHPTMKPVELIARAIRNSTRPGETILDPFTGSGTTLVAAQQKDRIGIGIELHPAYGAVTLQRLADEGLTPERIDPT
jgi:DNA modification methylase